MLSSSHHLLLNGCNHERRYTNLQISYETIVFETLGPVSLTLSELRLSEVGQRLSTISGKSREVSVFFPANFPSVSRAIMPQNFEARWLRQYTKNCFDLIVNLNNEKRLSNSVASMVDDF